MISLLLLLLITIIGLALFALGAIVVLALIVGVVKYTLNPKALIFDLKAGIRRRL